MRISRRAFCESGLSLPVVRVLPAALVLTAPSIAKAEPISTTITVVSLALNVARLFSSSSGSIDGLMQVQMNAISLLAKQVEVIHEQLNLVINHLEEIKSLIKDLPRDLVVELQKAQISGAAKGFSEVTKTLERETQDQKIGIEHARANRKTE
jgi:hypothetical protein